MMDGTPVLTIINTGTDITIMRIVKYVRLGSPHFRKKNIQFGHIGSETNATFERFQVKLLVDRN